MKIRIICIILILFVTEHSVAQNAKYLSLYSEVGLYRPVLYEYSTLQYGSNGIVGTGYTPIQTNYNSFYDKHCLAIKQGFAYEQELNRRMSFVVGISFLTSHNKFEYEHIYAQENLYGQFKSEERFNSFVLDGLLKYKFFTLKYKFSFGAFCGFELSNLFNYRQLYKEMRIGTLINGQKEENLAFENFNEFSRVNYLLLFRPRAGITFQLKMNKKWILSLSPSISSRSLYNSEYGSGVENPQSTLPPTQFESYRTGEYRSSITLSGILSIGFKL